MLLSYEKTLSSFVMHNAANQPSHLYKLVRIICQPSSETLRQGLLLPSLSLRSIAIYRASIAIACLLQSISPCPAPEPFFRKISRRFGCAPAPCKPLLGIECGRVISRFLRKCFHSLDARGVIALPRSFRVGCLGRKNRRASQITVAYANLEGVVIDGLEARGASLLQIKQVESLTAQCKRFAGIQTYEHAVAHNLVDLCKSCSSFVAFKLLEFPSVFAPFTLAFKPKFVQNLLLPL